MTNRRFIEFEFCVWANFLSFSKIWTRKISQRFTIFNSGRTTGWSLSYLTAKLRSFDAPGSNKSAQQIQTKTLKQHALKAFIGVYCSDNFAPRKNNT
jgi:hypothetical protein